MTSMPGTTPGWTQVSRGAVPGDQRVIERGSVWWADLAEPRGSQPAYRRPVAVVSADTYQPQSHRHVLEERLGRLGSDDLERVDAGLRRVLDR